MTTQTVSQPARPVRIRPDFAPDMKRRHAEELFAHGLGYQKTAEILGLSPYTVRDWARAYKAGRFGTVLAANQMRYSEEEREKVLALRAQGLSWRAIAEQTGVKMATCRKWVMAAQNPKTE